MEATEQFLQWVEESGNIVFFGGAGVSTESGIPDFRSVDGLYNQQYKYPPETILSHSFYRQNPEEFYRFYRNKMLCLMGLALHDSWIKQLENTTMPTVLLDNFISGNPNVCYLGTDSYEGITMAVNHLVNLGHKNIAFLNGSLYSLVSDQRQEAFESAMAAASLPVQKDLTAYGYYVSDSAKYHVPGFLAAGATAVVCGNDLIAKGVIDECTKRGFRVPEDVSVVGFDDISIAATFDPPLTTIRQERNELGRCAYDILNSLIHHIPISKTLLRPKLIERESTARCAHRD